MIAPFEIALCRAGFRQRKTLVDDDLKLVLLHELQNLIELLEVFRLRLEIIGNREARRLAAVGKRRRSVGKRAKRAADGNQSAGGSQGLQTLLINFAADHFQYDIDAAVIRHAHDFLPEIMRVTDNRGVDVVLEM